MIRLTGLGVSYDGGTSFAVRGVDLHVPEGQLVAFVGGSGSGKTTTLRTINRLVEPTEGTVEVDGRDVTAVDDVELRRRIGYVLQGTALFPHRTIRDNVATVPRLLGWPAERIDPRVDELLALMDLDPPTFRDRMPSQLSGGQRQRVGVARALAAEPRIVLMDEPFGALDPVTRDALQADYRRLHDDLGVTTVMVTHDMAEALGMADVVVVMKDGAVLRAGAPAELLSDPGHPYVADLLETPKRQAALLARLQAEA